jgi:hypothetical protein
MFFLTKHNTLSKYKNYREVGKALNHKIIDRFVDRDIILLSGKYLGLVSLVKKNALIFNNESETAALMDFAINEYKINGNSAVQLYKDKGMFENQIEVDILDALLKSYTSLFKITNIISQKNTLILTDLLNINCEPIEIIDIELSQTAVAGFLIFLRIVPFSDFNISGGLGFAFNNDMEEYLIKKYKNLAKLDKSSSESLKRYVAFFKLYKRYGLEIDFR